MPFESEDGHTLYYEHDPKIRETPVRGGKELDLPVSTYKDNFALAKHGLYFIDENDVDLKFFDFETHAIKSIAPVPGPIGDEMGISPDER